MKKYIVGDHYYGATRMKRGFNTIDHSNFLTPGEVEVLEKGGVYLTARGLNSNPGREEIEEYPINYAFYKLPPPSNRSVYLQSKYTGSANHTPARFGNYFSHSIILKNVHPDFPATFIFDQAEFRKSFTLEEEDTYSTKLTEREIPISSQDNQYEIAFNQFSNFLLASNNLDVFSRAIDLIVDGVFSIRGNNITICAGKDQVKELIFSINFFLPLHIANKISFATYVNNPSKYPFHITGIIPACEIESFDTKNYFLINADEEFRYTPKHPYTNFLINLIRRNSATSFLQWRSVNEEMIVFNVSEPNLKLNVPVIYRHFVESIESKDIQELKNILKLNLPEIKQQEIRLLMLERNPDLYLNFAIDEMKKGLGQTFTTKKQSFLKIYQEYCEKNLHFRQHYLSGFANAFFDLLESKEKIIGIVYVLINSDCTDLHDDTWIGSQLKLANSWFDNDYTGLEDKLGPAEKLCSKYTISKLPQEDTLYIMRYKHLSDLIEQIATAGGSLRQSIAKYRDVILALTPKERREVLLSCFNSSFLKGRFKYDFNIHISIVGEILPEYQADFWAHFFDNNSKYNKGKNYSLIPLEYLKKNFMCYLFLNDIDKIGILKDLELNGDLLNWISDNLTANAPEHAVIERYEEVLVARYRRRGFFR